MYVKVTNSIAEIYTIRRLKKDNPNVSFPENIPESILAEYDVYPYVEQDKPAFNEDTQVLQAGNIIDNAGTWTQTWTVRDLTAEELQARVPKEVSMRQARLALNAAGLLAQVETAMATADDASKIEWEYASTVRRDSPIVVSMSAALGFTDAQLDDLFKTAITL